MTTQEPFYFNPETYINGYMMHQNGSYLYANLINLKFESLMLNFKDHYKMLILLPQSDVEVLQVLRLVTSFGLKSITKRMQRKILAVSVPRAFVQTRSSIKSVLAQSDFLSDQNYSSTNEDLAKPDVVQHSGLNLVENEHIDRNNETPASPELVEGEFNANSRFLYFIMDKTSDEVIFSGQFGLIYQ